MLRFFAGLFGGPCVVNIEGTFADIWSAKTTNTYYAFLGTAQFFGAGLGPLVGGFIVQATNGWRYTQFFSAALCALVGIFGIGMSESYQREIPRRRAKRQGHTLQQEPALSGVTVGQMLRTTVFDPIVQVFTEPVVAMATFILIFNFAVVMQFIITVPVALGSPPPAGPGFSIAHVGVAFTTVFGGAGLAALFNILIEQAVSLPMISKRHIPDFAAIEFRLIPSMFGTIFVTASLFWIGKKSLSVSESTTLLTTSRRHRRESEFPTHRTNRRHCSLRPGRSHDSTVGGSLPLRRLPARRHTLRPNRRSLRSPSLRGLASASHLAVLHRRHS